MSCGLSTAELIHDQGHPPWVEALLMLDQHLACHLVETSSNGCQGPQVSKAPC